MMPHAMIRRLVHDRQAGVAVLFALSLPIVIGSAGMAIDGALLEISRTNLQNAADAAALGAIRSLPDASNTTAAAIALANANLPPTAVPNSEKGSSKSGGEESKGSSGKSAESSPPASVLVSKDVIIGTWDDTTHKFTVGGSTPNATKVTTRYAAANNNAHKIYFGAFLGQAQVDLAATSIARACVINPDYAQSSSYSPTATKVITVGENSPVNYLETSDGHPIVRLDNAFQGADDVTVSINGAPGVTSQVFHVPKFGSFNVVVTSVTDTTRNGKMTIVFQVKSTVSNTPRGGGTATWVNNIRSVAGPPGAPVCGGSSGSKIKGTLVT